MSCLFIKQVMGIPELLAEGIPFSLFSLEITESGYRLKGIRRGERVIRRRSKGKRIHGGLKSK